LNDENKTDRTKCSDHNVHELRIKTNENDIKEIQQIMKNDAWWGRVLAFAGVLFTGLCSFGAVIVGFLGKAKGWW